VVAVAASARRRLDQARREALRGRAQVAGGVWTCAADHRLIVVCHPLEDTREDWWSDRLSDAVADAEDRCLAPAGGKAECHASFDLLRRPGAVFAGL
jgi:hypothetical protein